MTRRYQVRAINDRYAVEDTFTNETLILRSLTPAGLVTAQRMAERANAREMTRILVRTSGVVATRKAVAS